MLRNPLASLRRFSLAAALAGTALTGLAGQASAATPVRINQAFQSLLYLPLYVAQDAGFFAKEGLDVKISTGGGGAQSWAAVIGGSADFSIQDPVFVPKANESGYANGVVVAGIQNAPTVFIIGKDGTSLQGDLSHLAGKRVITSPQPDTTWAFMTYLIQQQKLKGVKIVHVAIGNEIPAIVAGQADYALAVEPQVEQSIAQNGLHSVYSFSADASWYPFAFSSLTTTKSYIAKNPQAAQGVITAFEMADRYIYSHTNETIAIAEKYFPDLPKDVVAKAVMREIDAKGYPMDALVTQTAWDNNMKIALYAQNIQAYPDASTSYAANVDTTLANNAKMAVDGK